MHLSPSYVCLKIFQHGRIIKQVSIEEVKLSQGTGSKRVNTVTGSKNNQRDTFFIPWYL